ncbi:MAG TPA: glycoside hydrolase family 130 protein [Planctomycetota bacterium]|jgi:beta-1,4-mannooligosaccharide/beta-1,4-mannosyl-N-acetylglucosamine phosphorylase
MAKASVRKTTIIGDALPNIPWEDKPAGYPGVCWRYSKNPVIPRNLNPMSNSIFNSAVVPFKGEFAGVFRCDDTRRFMQIHSGRSKDGINWKINPERIHFVGDETDPALLHWEYGYDPRVCWIEDRYYVTWCNGYHGPTIGMAWTKDFETYHKMENSLLPFNRNGVLFPRKIGGKYVMLSRPSDNGHTPFGDIFLSHSPDMVHWGCHRFVMGTKFGWQSTKIGAGPIPIETREGWLMIYHGVLTSCNGFVYSYGAALLDIDQPWKVIYRTEPYIMSPQAPYELAGDVPNVAFPCAALVDAPTGRIAIYYGCADTVTGLAFCQVDELIDFVKTHSKV